MMLRRALAAVGKDIGCVNEHGLKRTDTDRHRLDAEGRSHAAAAA